MNERQRELEIMLEAEDACRRAASDLVDDQRGAALAADWVAIDHADAAESTRTGTCVLRISRPRTHACVGEVARFHSWAADRAVHPADMTVLLCDLGVLTWARDGHSLSAAE